MPVWAPWAVGGPPFENSCLFTCRLLDSFSAYGLVFPVCLGCLLYGPSSQAAHFLPGRKADSAHSLSCLHAHEEAMLGSEALHSTAACLPCCKRREDRAGRGMGWGQARQASLQQDRQRQLESQMR